MNWWREGSPYRNRDIMIADGSIRSGKTIACICSFLIWSMECFSGQNFILSGKTIGSLKKNVIGPMLQILTAWGIPYRYVRSGEQYIEIGTNTYYLYDAHNESSQDKIQGLTAAGALADEAALFPPEFYRADDRTMLCRRCKNLHELQSGESCTLCKDGTAG